MKKRKHKRVKTSTSKRPAKMPRRGPLHVLALKAKRAKAMESSAAQYAQRPLFDVPEEWRRHPRFVLYLVSSHGQVQQTETGTIVKQTVELRRGKPTLRVQLIERIKREKYVVHRDVRRLVLECFIGPACGQVQAEQKNGDYLDCTAWNLRWAARPKMISAMRLSKTLVPMTVCPTCRRAW